MIFNLATTAEPPFLVVVRAMVKERDTLKSEECAHRERERKRRETRNYTNKG